MNTEPMTPARRLRNIIGGSAGNLVEWFDWYAYAAFTLYFAPLFFPSANDTADYGARSPAFAAFTAETTTIPAINSTKSNNTFSIIILLAARLPERLSKALALLLPVLWQVAPVNYVRGSALTCRE